jgi:hypothetical protein
VKIRTDETVTCLLCGAVWLVPIGTASAAYHQHYLDAHRDELEGER